MFSNFEIELSIVKMFLLPILVKLCFQIVLSIIVKMFLEDGAEKARHVKIGTNMK